MEDLKIAICVIGRLENAYVKEFVQWYEKMSFDKIFIYDNNHDNEERFEDKIQSWIDNGFVEIVNFRNREKSQLPAYDDCYKKHGDEYDFIAYIDFDEFLVLNEKYHNNIKAYLSEPIFKSYDCIHINWMIYDDNGLIKCDDRPLNERFTHPIDYDKHINYDQPENNHVKSILRGGLGNITWGNPHSPYKNLNCCNNVGKKVNDSFCCQHNYELAYLKHFRYKTIEEFLNNKIKRGTADRSYSTFLSTYDIDGFFKFNERTKEKEEFIEKWKHPC